MNREFTKNGLLVQSDDGVIVNTHYNHELASYELNGEKWIVPWEYVERDGAIVQLLYINRGAVYKQGALGVPADEAMLNQLREDMLAAFEALGLRAILRQSPS